MPRPAVADRSPGVPRPRRRRRRACKRSVIRALEWTGEFFGNTEKFARIVLDEVADVPDPKILELGSGHGGLSRKLLEWHPTAELTVTDIEPRSVAGDRGRRPRRAPAGDGARDGRHGDRRARRAFRPGGVRVVVSPPAAAAGVAGVRRRHPRGRQAADHRPAAAAVTAAHRCGWRRCCRWRRWCRSCTTA